MPNRNGDSAQSSLLSTLGAVVSVATGTGLFYAIGFFFLIDQLNFNYFDDIRVSLYAASLVPTTVVLGQALYGLLHYQIFPGTVLLSVGLSIYPIWQNAKAERRRVIVINEGSPQRLHALHQAKIVIVYIIMIAIVVNVFVEPSGLMGYFMWMVMLAGIAVVGLAFIYRSMRLRWRLALIVCAVYFNLLNLLLYDTPPVSPIELRLEGETNPLIKGSLLAHSDGYWHVIVLADGNTPRKFRLVSVPDNRATETSIVGELPNRPH